jgi:hypothetical protein
MKGQHAFVTIAMMIVFGLIAYVNRGHLIIEATNKKQKSFMMNTRGKVMPSYNKGADTPDTIDDQENEVRLCLQHYNRMYIGFVELILTFIHSFLYFLFPSEQGSVSQVAQMQSLRGIGQSRTSDSCDSKEQDNIAPTGRRLVLFR